MLPSALNTGYRSQMFNRLRWSRIANWHFSEQAATSPKLDSNNRGRNDLTLLTGGAGVLSAGPVTQSTLLLLGPNRLTLPHDPIFNVAKTDFTFAFWAKTPTGTAQVGFLSKRLHDADER